MYEDQVDASRKAAKLKPRWFMDHLNHTAFNICLFPPLFFFYCLYYTDVVSALLVLMTYHFHLLQARKSVMVAGLMSLLLRQTNIFWIAIFLGGLQTVQTLKKVRSDAEISKNDTFFQVVTGSLQHGCLYDPLVSEARAEGIFESLSIEPSPGILIRTTSDYVKTCFSIALATISNLQVVLQSLLPYLSLLWVFASFVTWNGGVVLGMSHSPVRLPCAYCIKGTRRITWLPFIR